jgi:hypothetical protein
VIGFKDRRKGLVAALSMFLLGILMAGEHFSLGRAVELGDILANAAGGCHLNSKVTADGSIKWPPVWQNLFKLNNTASRRPFIAKA